MIERLLAAEAALARDELDHAQRLFGQVAEADPRNAIAVVGLARVVARRGDTDAARELLTHALELDPDEAAAHRLMAELGTAQDASAQHASSQHAPIEVVAEPAVIPAPTVIPGPMLTPPPVTTNAPSAPRRRSLLARLLGRLGLGRR